MTTSSTGDAMPTDDMPAHPLPVHAVPTHAVPTHAVPAYDVPARAVPAYDVPVRELAADDTPPRSAKPTSPFRHLRTGIIVVLTLALLALLVIFGPTGWLVFRESGPTLSTPGTVDTFQLDSSPDSTDAADYVRDAVATEVNLDKSIGAVYTRNGDTAHSAIVVAGTALIWSPDDALKRAFSVVVDQAGGVKGLTTVPAGPLGGLMRCGTTATDNGDMAVCGWADHGCVAVVLLPGIPATDAPAVTRTIRAAIQHR